MIERSTTLIAIAENDRANNNPATSRRLRPVSMILTILSSDFIFPPKPLEDEFVSCIGTALGLNTLENFICPPLCLNRGQLTIRFWKQCFPALSALVLFSSILNVFQIAF